RPRQTILKDDVLTQLALTVPTTQEAMAKTRGLPKYLHSGAQTDTILQLMQEAKKATADTMPRRPETPNLSSSQEDQLEIIKLVLKVVARQHNVSSKLIAV